MGTRTHAELGRLLERSVELDALRRAVDAVAAGEGRVVVVEGPAGIGKTALVDAAHARARDHGLGPLAARGTELERAFGFGVVRQLLEPAVHDGGAAAFEGAARYAAALLDVPLAESTPVPLGPETTFMVLHGLYHLTANLARDRPLALLVDDAHWADDASLRFLAYLGKRLVPTPRQDTEPFQGECPHGGLMGFPLVALLLGRALGPAGMLERFSGPLHTRLSQAFRTLEVLVHPGFCPAAFRDRCYAGVFLACLDSGVTLPLFATGHQEAGSKDRPGPGPGVKQGKVGMALGVSRDSGVKASLAHREEALQLVMKD